MIDESSPRPSEPAIEWMRDKVGDPGVPEMVQRWAEEWLLLLSPVSDNADSCEAVSDKPDQPQPSDSHQSASDGCVYRGKNITVFKGPSGEVFAHRYDDEWIVCDGTDLNTIGGLTQPLAIAKARELAGLAEAEPELPPMPEEFRRQMYELADSMCSFDDNDVFAERMWRAAQDGGGE